MALAAVDLFAGLGGFSEGARREGVDVLWAANHWADAVTYHTANHPRTRHTCQDLMSLDWTCLPDIREGLLLASPACQGHSTAGQPAARGSGGSHPPSEPWAREKHQADRNTSWAVLAALDSARPRWAIIENVIPFQRWGLFDAWLEVMRAMGYAVRVHTLNGRDFGSAQDRPRTIITASLGPAVELDHANAAAKRQAGDCLDLGDHPDHRWGRIDAKSARMVPKMRRAQQQAGGVCLWNNVSESRGRMLGEAFPTITTKSGSQLYLLDGDRARILNPRELARAQSFPDSYLIPEERGLASRLIGNAIDVTLARAVVAQVVATS